MNQSNDLIRQIIDMTRRMIILADEGHALANDDGCRLLIGIIQDCAYKIRKKAEQEKEEHRKTSEWNDRAGSERQAIQSKQKNVGLEAL